LLDFLIVGFYFVGMVLQCQFAIGFFDILAFGSALEAEDLVIVVGVELFRVAGIGVGVGIGACLSSGM